MNPGKAHSHRWMFSRALGLCLMLGAIAEGSNVKRMTIRQFAEEDTQPVETNVYKQVEGIDLRLLAVKPDDWAEGQV